MAARTGGGKGDGSAAAVEGGLAGRLLIAMPSIGDPRFERTVIYMLAHDRGGARGLIVNRPASDVAFPELLKQLDIRGDADLRGFRVRIGGPVEPERGFVLHSTDYHRPEATLRVDDAVAMTATLDVLQAIAEGRGPARALFALGYAGWASGQLEQEIRGNAWLDAAADPDLVFGEDDDGKWRRALAKIGVTLSMLSSTSGSA